MVTPAKRGRGKKTKAANDKQDQTPAERRAAMTWAQRLKRVFDIDIETCVECGGDVSPTWMVMKPLQQQDCCRNAGLRQQRAYSSEGPNHSRHLLFPIR
jgi:hypothetical protein